MLLDGGSRLLYSCARWRKTALPRRVVESGSCALLRHRIAAARIARRAALDGEAAFLGMGHTNHQRRGSPLQPNVIPQRVDMAARQRARRAWTCALWPDE